MLVLTVFLSGLKFAVRACSQNIDSEKEINTKLLDVANYLYYGCQILKACSVSCI